MVNPLTPEHQRQVDEALRTLNDQNELIDKCQRCNLDLGPLLQERARLIDQLMAIKRTFFTVGGNGPPVGGHTER